MRKKSEEIEALVLRSYPSGDYDMVYRLLSPRKGKLSAFAKSVRKSKKRFSTLPEPFDLGMAELKEGRGELMILGGFVPKKNFRTLRDSIAKFSTACTICECFDILIQEQTKEHHQELFDTAVDSLTALCDLQPGQAPTLPAERAIRKLMRLSGFLEEDSRPDHLSAAEQWEQILNRVERIIEKPLTTRSTLKKTGNLN